MQTSDIVGRIMSQITSGRWIITVAATFCLIKLTLTLCTLMVIGKIILETSTFVAIVMSVLNTVGMVTVFYFNKPRLNGDGNGNGNGDNGNGDNGNGDTTTTTTTLTK